MELNHRYGMEIQETDPLSVQPEKIKLALKPHQLACIYKACLMERSGQVKYSIPPPADQADVDQNAHLYPYYRPRRSSILRGNLQVHTNFGILGDMVGYGKTLTALGIIASTPLNDLYTDMELVYAYNGSSRNKSHLRITTEKTPIVDDRGVFNTTLVVVPKGPVYIQWVHALEENTTFNHIAINDVRTIKKKCPVAGSTNAQLKEFFDKLDVVLVTSTSIGTLMNYYDIPYQQSPIRGFQRIMIDEAPDCMHKVPIFDYKFLWLISATYHTLAHGAGHYNYMSCVARELLGDDRIHTVVVKCNDEFTKKSFIIPAYKEIVYQCEMHRNIAIVRNFLPNHVMEMVNANDIAGAIRELGGTTQTEDSILKIVSKNILRDIHNKEREKAYVESLDMAADAKASRIRYITADIEKLNQQKKDLEDRVTTYAKDVCPICFDTMENPIMLNCTHMFCGSCIMKWVKTYEENGGYVKCPNCREHIDRKKMVAIVKEDEASTSDGAKGKKGTAKKQQKDEPPKILPKPDTVMKIIEEKPDGRFLIFSLHDHSFHDVITKLDVNNITYSELKGHTGQMMKTLEKFKNGETQVIMLNATHLGSGIDISSATDVILFHSMGALNEQAIGRAQRVGRTESLTVHRLLYPNETNH